MDFTTALIDVLARTQPFKELINSDHHDSVDVDAALKFLVSQKIKNTQSGGNMNVTDYILTEAKYVGDKFTEIGKLLNDKINMQTFKNSSSADELKKLFDKILVKMHQLEKNNMPIIFLDLIEKDKILEKTNLLASDTILYIRTKMEGLYKYVISNPENSVTIRKINNNITNAMLPYQNNKLVYPILGLAINIAIKTENWNDAIKIIDKLDKNSPLYQKIKPETIQYLREKSANKLYGAAGADDNSLAPEIVAEKIQNHRANIHNRVLGDSTYVCKEIEYVIILVKSNPIVKNIAIKQVYKTFYQEALEYLKNTMYTCIDNDKNLEINYSKFYNTMEQKIKELIGAYMSLYPEGELDPDNLMEKNKNTLIKDYTNIINQAIINEYLDLLLRCTGNFQPKKIFDIDCKKIDKESELYTYLETIINNPFAKIFLTVLLDTSDTTKGKKVKCLTYPSFTPIDDIEALFDGKFIPIAAPILAVRNFQSNIPKTINLSILRSQDKNEWKLYACICKTNNEKYEVVYTDFDQIKSTQNSCWCWYEKSIQ
jgi:hypothetical protein